MDLYTARTEKKATQAEVARYAGISRAAYSNIETKKRRPSPDVAKRIGGFLGFDWTRFYDDKPIDDPKEAV